METISIFRQNSSSTSLLRNHCSNVFLIYQTSNQKFNLSKKIQRIVCFKPFFSLIVILHQYGRDKIYFKIKYSRFFVFVMLQYKRLAQLSGGNNKNIEYSFRNCGQQEASLHLTSNVCQLSTALFILCFYHVGCLLARIIHT